MRALYPAEATAHGGRHGQVRSSDGILDIDLRVPDEMGGRGYGQLLITPKTPAVSIFC